MSESYLPRAMHRDGTDITMAGKLSTGTHSRPTVSVIIVNYNVREFLSQALRSVERASSDHSVEVFVVDNNSVDGSVAMVERDFPNVTVISNSENVGFGRANNMAIREASGDYLLILNPDTIVQEDTLARMVDFFESHSDAGAVGCQILNPDGSFARESRRSFPTPDVAFYRMIGLSRLFPRSRRFGRYNMTYLPRDEVAEIDALSGSCMMIRSRTLLEEFGEPESPGSGFFDEEFFMYGEDLDLCFRIQKAGWKIYYVPDTQIIHYKGESTKKGDLKYVRLFYGAMLLFIEKHFNSSHSGVMTSLLKAGIMFRAGVSVLGRTLRRAAPAILDFSIVYLTVTALGYIRSIAADAELAELFFVSVSPAYALGTVLAIAVLGGYRRRGRHPVLTVVPGTLIGFLTIAVISFMVPAVAFSRIVVSLSLPIAAVLLLLRRMIPRSDVSRERAALLVGDENEASRLDRMLSLHPHPPFRLKGFVDAVPGPSALEVYNSDGPTAYRGNLNHLRDLVRLRQIDDVVFAARSLSNQTIFSTMRGLQDLGVQFRILHEGSEHLIGKSSINRLSLGSELTQIPVVLSVRSGSARRRFEILVCGIGLLLYPVLTILTLFKRRQPFFEHFLLLKRGFRHVIQGKISLVGYLPIHERVIASRWNLRPGLFSITNTLTAQELDDDDLARAYWYYVTHQSASLDASIILKSLRQQSREH
jgi:GT2 family glycosyltransferase